jgi:hypothetical protein
MRLMGKEGIVGVSASNLVGIEGAECICGRMEFSFIIFLAFRQHTLYKPQMWFSFAVYLIVLESRCYYRDYHKRSILLGCAPIYDAH